jgi:hypothetical protein
MEKVLAVPPPPVLLPPGIPLQEASTKAVRVKQARANIFLAGIIETLFSFVLRPSQAMAGNFVRFHYVHANRCRDVRASKDNGSSAEQAPKTASGHALPPLGLRVL